MTGTVAYILAKKMISSVTTGIQSVTSSGNNLEFHLADETILTIPVPQVGLVFTTKEELPQEGQENTLYVVDNQIMCWNGTEYETISGDGGSNELVWEPI